MKSKLLLLVQSHEHAAALMGCIPHVRANYDWLWIVYSPAVLADPALVEREFDQQIAEITTAMKACYGREDGAGGDAYKARRDAAVLDKAAKVKEAWKSLAKEQQDAAVERIFGPFFKERPAPNIAIHQAADHFETSAHVEFQNSLKAAMPKNYVPGQYVVAWPTALPSEEKPQDVKTPEPEAFPQNTGKTISLDVPTPKATPVKKGMEPRLRELLQMSLDGLGPIAFELGFAANNPIMGKRMALAHAIHKEEKQRANAA